MSFGNAILAKLGKQTNIFREKMKSKTKTVITLESWQKTSIRRKSVRTVWCERCAAEVETLSSDEAARISGSTPQLVYRQVENEEMHFIETEKGALLICGNSLTERFRP